MYSDLRFAIWASNSYHVCKSLIEEHSANGRMKELDELMTNYIDSQLNEIEKDLVAKYPNRAALFVEAFKAHRLEMYALSITVLLSQADGICIDSLGKEFFSMETVAGVKQPKTKKVIEAYGAGALQEMMLEPLLSGSGMGASEKEQALYSDSLRSQVRRKMPSINSRTLILINHTRRGSKWH